MCVDRIKNSPDLYCYKVVWMNGNICYYVDVSIYDAAISANEIDAIKSIEEIGDGAIGC